MTTETSIILGLSLFILLQKALYYFTFSYPLKFLVPGFCVCCVSLSIRYKLLSINVTLEDSTESSLAEVNAIRVLALGICILSFKILYLVFSPGWILLLFACQPQKFLTFKIHLLILKMPIVKNKNIKAIIANPGIFRPLPPQKDIDNVWRYFYLPHWGLLLASSGYRPEVLLNILQFTD